MIRYLLFIWRYLTRRSLEDHNSIILQGNIFWRFPPLRGGEKKSKNQKQGREIKGKDREKIMRKDRKKKKKAGNCKFPSTHYLISKSGYIPGREFSSLNYLWCANFLPWIESNFSLYTYWYIFYMWGHSVVVQVSSDYSRNWEDETGEEKRN